MVKIRPIASYSPKGEKLGRLVPAYTNMLKGQVVVQGLVSGTGNLYPMKKMLIVIREEKVRGIIIMRCTLLKFVRTRI